MPPDLLRLTAGATWERNDAGKAGASVFRLTLPGGDSCYLKHGAGRVADDVVDEAARLRWLGRRLPAPAIRLFACASDAAWLLTDTVPGLTADEWVERGPDRLPSLVRGMAEYMRRLHALFADECPFDAGHAVRLHVARRNVAEGLVAEGEFDAEREGWTAAAVLDEALRLVPDAPGRAVTHGDFSMGNLLLDGAGRVTGCIDVGRLGVADPYQDIAILWNDLGEYGREAQALLLRELGIAQVDERRLRFHLCLDELF